MASFELTCTHCGKVFARPDGGDAASRATLVDEESARCRRLVEVLHQRQSLAARMQGGVAGLVGHDPLDTVDMVAQRASLQKLDAALKEEQETLEAGMAHVPGVQ